jgi:hypothetical protein
MLDALPSGIGPSSQLRAAIAALSAHLAIVVAAIYGTAHQIVAPAVTRRDTVRIELPTMPTGEGTERAGSVPTAPPLPTAPLPPVFPLDQPTPTMSLTVAADAGALAALREAAVRDVGTLRAASEGTTPLPVSALDELPALLNDLSPRYPEELRAAPSMVKSWSSTSLIGTGGFWRTRSGQYGAIIQDSPVPSERPCSPPVSDRASEGEDRFRCWFGRGSGLKLTEARELSCLPKVSWEVT